MAHLSPGAITGITLGTLTLLTLLLALTTILIKRSRNPKTKSLLTNLKYHPRKLSFTTTPRAPAELEHRTAEQINEAVERRYAAEKASRTVVVSAEQVDDAISLDSQGHGPVEMVGVFGSGAVGDVTGGAGAVVTTTSTAATAAAAASA